MERVKCTNLTNKKKGRHCLMFDHTIRKRMQYDEFTYVSVSVGISNHLIATI